MSDDNVYYEEREDSGLNEDSVTRDENATHSRDPWLRSYTNFTVSENGSAKGKQWENIEGATARIGSAHYQYLPDAPDQHGQAKLFHYYPPMLVSLQSTEGASPSSIGKVLAMAKKKAGPELVHSDMLNPYSLKTTKGAVKRGDVKSPIDQYRGTRVPMEDYDNSVDIDYNDAIFDKVHELDYDGEGRNVSAERAENEVMKDYREDGVNAARSAILSSLRHTEDPERYANEYGDHSFKIREVPSSEVDQSVKDAIAMRDPDRSYSILAADQSAAIAEYNKIQNDNKNDVDLFGNPTVVRKLYRQGE
jgi:hypothetical protein